MASDLPTETATDRSALRWTDDERVGPASNERTDAVRDRTDTFRDADSPPSVSDARDVERLEAELERKEEQLHYVTERYEHLLEKKNRQLAGKTDADAVSDRDHSIRARLKRYLPW